MVYEMATGRTPFASRSIAEACAKHLHETPAPLRAHAPGVLETLDTLTLRLLAKEPADRIESIDALEQRFAELAHTAPDSDLAAPTYEVNAAWDAMAETQPQHSTTLTAAASMTRRPVAGRRATVSAVAVAVLAAVAFAAWRFTRPPRPAVPPVAIAEPAELAPGPGSEPPVDSPARRKRELVAWIEAANPFVTWRNTRWLAHQVTRREYRRFLESLPVSEALRHQPVTGWDDSELTRPVAWVTYERAAAFCAAIDAALPTSEQWLEAADGQWGLDPAASGQRGPLQEWTSTLRDGLAIVRGGHDAMPATERGAAVSEPLMKLTEAAAGPSPAPHVVGAATIGFRCVR